MRIVGLYREFLEHCVQLGVRFGNDRGALTLEDAHLSFQKIYPDAKSVPVAEVVRCLKKLQSEHLKGIQFQVVSISGMDSADKVIADVACKLYLIVVQKPSGSSTNAWFKLSDHASTAAAAADAALKLTDTNWHMIFNGEGMPYGTGITAGSHTTVNGNTKSAAADAPLGLAIVGGP